MERLIKSLELTEGELFYTKNGRRYKLASCKPTLEIHEISTPVYSIGRVSPGIKTIYYEVVLCEEEETVFCREIDEHFFSETVAFSMKADVYRPDGVYETLFFDQINFEEFTEDGTLTFRLMCPQELANKLLRY